MSKCNVCNNFQRSPRQFRVAFDFRLAQIIQSAERGCLVCSLLLNGMRCFESKIGGFTEWHHIQVWGDSIEGSGSIEMEIYNNGALELCLEYFVANSEGSLFKGARTLPTIPGDTACDASMDWAKRLLQNCTSSHPACGQRSDPELPTRILDIGSNESDPPIVKLIQNRNGRAKYACLSHCWGSTRALVTERETISLHTSQISWETLPQTFQEAVLITRSLGLQYLWIDSLCIIQDDLEDWRRESASMSSTYTNSYITIAATKSYGDSGGCYSTASPYHQDYRLSLRRPDSSIMQTDLYVREKISHIGEPGAVTPLLKRGWVCQERLLSPRVLHYCEKELVWECEALSGCQCSCFNPPGRIKEEYSSLFHHAERASYAPNDIMVSSNHIVGTDDAINSPDVASTGELPTMQDSDDSDSNTDDDTDLGRPASCPTASEMDGAEHHHSYAVHHNSSLYENPSRKNRHSTVLEKREGFWSRAFRSAVRKLSGEDKRRPLPVSKPSNPPIKAHTETQFVVQEEEQSHPPVQEEEQSRPPVIDDDTVLKWRRIVSGYSGLSLTKQSDRLPAIAGVARQFGEIVGSTYLAGLWQSALPEDLLWHVDGTLDTRQERLLYRAPSWSWASVDGKVDYYRIKTSDPGVSIVRAACTPVATIDPFGEVESGVLEIEARMIPIRITIDMSEDKTCSRRRLKTKFFGNNAIFVPDYDISMAMAAKPPVPFAENVLVLDLWCFGDFVAEQIDKSDTHNRKEFGVSLVVQEIGTNQYERIGILERDQQARSEKSPFTVTARETSAELEESKEQERFILL